MHYTALDGQQRDEVIRLFYDTFKSSENEVEARAVSALVGRYLENYPREDLLGYVALEDAAIVGCVFFSELDFPESDKKVFILSPMAVKTEVQGRGIGQRLISYAHNELRKRGVNLTATYGDIRFYSKSGYALVSTGDIAAPLKLTYPEGWLALSLDGETALKVEGPSICIPEMHAEELW